MSDRAERTKAKKRFASVTTATVLFGIAIVHGFFPSRFTLDWPAVALIGLSGVILHWRKIEALLPLIKRLKLGEAEIEIQQKTGELAHSVQDSEREAKQLPTVGIPESELASKSIEHEILDLAARDKSAAMIRLSMELEREVLSLQGMLGLRNQARTNTLAEALRQLKEHKAITNRMTVAIEEFWEIRSGLLHGTSIFPEALLTSALDSGMRLLALLRAIPRPTYEVADPSVPLYKDRALKSRIDEYCGVMIEATLSDGAKASQLFPAGRVFERGETVGWDWDISRRFGPAYYADKNGEPLLAWSSSSAFVGRPERKREDSAAAGR
jgi:hypothetical protein